MMGTLDQFSVVPPASSISSDDFLADQPSPSPTKSAMSLPHLRKWLQVYRSESKRQGKLSQESVASSQYQSSSTQLSKTAPTSSGIPDRHNVNVEVDGCSPGESTRKRDRIQQWLSHQMQRLDRFKQGVREHHDSMFEEENIEKALKRASEDANSIVPGPDGEPIDQRVIDHFFMLHPSGGSDWRDSVRWERHLIKCLRMQCEICRSQQCKSEETSSQSQVPPSSPSPSRRSNPTQAPRAPKESGFPKDVSAALQRWRLRSRKDKVKTSDPKEKGSKSEDKGKSRATDEDYELLHVLETLCRPQAQLTEYRPERPRRNLPLQDAIRRTQKKPVFCTFVSKPLNPRQIPVPAPLDLKPADSSALDLTNLAHATGRPYEACPLEEGRLLFPLCGGYLPPPTPELRPEQLIESVPEPFLLADGAREPPDGALFPMSPVRSNNTSTESLQQGIRQTIRLVRSNSNSKEDQVLAPERNEHPTPEATDLTSLLRAAAAELSHRSTTPAHAFPPTPPDSRKTSEAFSVDFAYTSCGAKLPATKRPPSPEGPADRDLATCKLSDTTMSSSPDCPVYVSPKEARGECWEAAVGRRGSGMGVWR